jgi:TolA-binding protein
MIRSARVVLVAGLAAVVAAPGCAYFNTLHNARAKYDEAQDIKETADPERERISNREETLYDEAIEKAAKVVKYYPDSKWVDDALLLMGKAAFESGEYSTAARKFDEILSIYPNSDLVPETLLLKGRTHVATKEYPQAIEALTLASEYDKKEIRGGVRYFSGVVQEELGERDKALVSFAEVLSRHKGSEWFAEAGLRAGEIAEEQGDLDAAIGYYDKVRGKASIWADRFRGGMRMGEAYLAAGQYEQAKKAYRNVAGNAPNDKDKGKALQAWGNVFYAEGEVDEARKIYARIMKEYPLSESAANAQLAIARTWDDAGDLERAALEYDKVREEGSGFEAWQIASKRGALLQSVIDLRIAIEKDDDDDRERKRYLLAEQLLEDIGDVDGALVEYSSLADDAFGSEWGAKALFAEAWVLEHRMENPDSAAVKFHRLANYYAGTEPDRYARQRFGYPVWKVEVVDVPPIRFIVPDDMDARPEDIVLSRVEPREVPLPPGVSQVEVWIRLTIDDDGRITVAQYMFPPRPPEVPAQTPEETPAEVPLEPAASDTAGAAPFSTTVESSGRKASVPDSVVAPEGFLSAPVDTAFPTRQPEANPTLRGKTFDPEN